MYDYAWVHVLYTIPLASVLTVILAPLLTRLDAYKIIFLITVAFTYTLPWDSYLVKNRIWTYPAEAVLGPTLLAVPIEELFFFVIQTYTTTCIQILLNKPVLGPAYLRNEVAEQHTPGVRNLGAWKKGGQIFFATIFVAFAFIDFGTEATYIGLILAWVAPIFFMLWTFAYQFLVNLPWTKTWLPIAVPTLFLWIVDTLALHRGTWSIELGTKLGINLWPHLDLEEAVFFLVTNCMIVFGACAFDNAVAVMDVFPNQFPVVPALPSPALMLQALFMPTTAYDVQRLHGLQDALSVLAKKSRSFYLASGVFTGRLRIDLILLYGFCRVADDLIDDAPSVDEARKWVRHFTEFLDASYAEKPEIGRVRQALEPFPKEAQSVLRLLPTEKLPPKPLYELIDGFKMDLQFLDAGAGQRPPIQTEKDLERYATCVAATVGELCLSLVYYHNPDKRSVDPQSKQATIDAAIRMGRVLQYVNIARDVSTDAEVGRCYIPSQWFVTTGADQTKRQSEEETLRLRTRILEKAFEGYRTNRDAIEDLPSYAKDGIRVAVESYMEIGRELRRRVRDGQDLDFAGGGRKGRASVPRQRRLWVGWRAMSGWRGPA